MTPEEEVNVDVEVLEQKISREGATTSSYNLDHIVLRMLYREQERLALKNFDELMPREEALSKSTKFSPKDFKAMLDEEERKYANK